MLDQMRKHSRSFIIYIFFGIIIAVFVINFGPQSRGCVAETSYAGQINGEPLSMSDLSYAMSVAGFGGQAMSEAQLNQLRAFAVDRLIVRELMAAKARHEGLLISDKEIRDMLLQGRYLALGMQRRFNPDGEPLDYERFSKYVRFNWRITVRKFTEQQRQELLAEQLREMQRLAIKTSPEEAKRDFIHRNTRANLSYVRIDTETVQNTIEPTIEQINQFASQNADQIKKSYEDHKATYTNRPEELLLRMIAIDQKVAGGKEQALKKAEALRAQLTAGADFADLASKSSQHESKTRGGALGWVEPSTTGLGEADQKAIAALEIGAISQPVQTASGAFLFKLEGKRKGDLTLDQVRSQIARTLLVDQLADARAKELAAGYISQLQAGQKPDVLFASDEASTADEAGKAGEANEAGQATQANGDQGDGKAQDQRPKLQATGPFVRSTEHLVPGIGISKDLGKLAFELKAGQTVDHPIQVGSAYYVVIVKERDEADMKEWASRQDELVEEFEQRRWAEAERDFQSELCQQAVKDKRVRINAQALSSREPGSEPTAAPTYVPCQTLRLL